jgi:acyl transferase domain-containing protein/acyl-CoA synthetase (AMP-forming)/AMP-acid ligase II/acyl carrier protein
MTSSRSSASAPATLLALLRGRARTEPDRRAYLFLADGETESARLTYGELDARARAIGARLQAVAAAGDRALLLYPPGLEFLSAFFGCLYAGVIAVPSYPPKRNRPDPRLQAIATDAGAKLVLTDADVLGELEPRLTHTPELRALQWLATDTIPGAEAAAWREPAIDGSQLAFLQYTSGSTSTPKGVMVSHGNLLHNLDDLDRGWAHTRDSVMVTWLPIFHDMGLIYGALMPLFKGFPCVMLPPSSFLQRPSRWLEAITRHRGTHSAAPNFAYDLCVASTTPEQRAKFDLGSWHFSLNAAEPVRAETLAAFNAAFAPCGLSPLTVSPGFGLAEATLKVSALPRAEPTRLAHVRSDELAQHRVVLGEPGAAGVQPIVGCGWGQVDNRYLIVDPETRQPCPEDRVGEIWFGGPSVAQGYWNRPRETAETFGATLATGEGPFMRTGDLGFVRGREVYVTGRVKDMIILRGLNHYPQDIELTVEKAHPALRPSCGAAFSVELDGREALVVAQEVERTHLRKLHVDEVVAAIRRAVAEAHELPVSAIVLLRTGSIPKTSSGKIMRRACRQQYLQDGLEVVGEWRLPKENAAPLAAAGAEPLVSLETAVIETWITVRLAQRLNLSPKQIDPREPFSRYGLDSLAAVELSGALERWLGRRLPPTLVYDYPSIHALADYLAVATATAPAAGLVTPEPAAASSDDAIAILGLGCRFPGAGSPDAFWQLLREGRDAIARVPAGRWEPATTDAPAWGGFLENIDTFDADFFGIAPREADLMDPQQRLLLEVAYEALEDAGLVPKALAGTRAGVFVGISTNDYGRLLARVAAGTDAHAGTGNAVSIAANRISYLLDLRGPSLAVDTACSSSLVAVHHAVRSLRAGESTLALVGGVNLILAPDLTKTFARAGMLAPDGRCKTFDAAADGYVRGEGCGVVVLKRLADAQRDGDRVLAVIRGSAVNQDGRSNGLTAPNGPAQQAVVRAALQDAGVAPAAIGCVEAHGTGTSLGDPIEANALREVLLERRSAAQPCWLGSVKTNLGHLEAAAGIAGLIKLVLALRHETIPPHLHLRSLNPLIQLGNTPLAIPTAPTPWRGPGRLAGVSSFGFGGTNAHVIVGEAPASAVPAQPARPAHVLVLSARTLPALRALAASHADASDESWADRCHAVATQRAAYAHRLAVTRENAAQLAEFAHGGQPAGVVSGEVAEPPRIAFVFSSSAGTSANTGRELYATQPVFRAAIEACDAIVAGKGRDGRPARPGSETGVSSSWTLSEAFTGSHSTLPAACADVARFALEYALARMWQAWGLEPSAVLGAGIGEYSAAVIAGPLTLEDALALLLARTRQVSGADFAAIVADTKLSPPAKPFFSALIAGAVSAELTRPEHWVKLHESSPRLDETMRALQATGVTLGLEIGAGCSDWSHVLEAAGRAFVAGAPVRWDEADRGFSFGRVALPHYPFQRQRHWFEATPVATANLDELSRLASDPSLSAADRAAVPRLLAALARARADVERVSDPLRPGQKPGLLDLANCEYEIRWPAEPRSTVPETAPARWLILGSPPADLKAAFAARGQAAECAEEFRTGEWRGVIFWAGAASGEVETARLVRAAQSPAAPLSIVSCGAIAVAPAEGRALRLDHAPLWGVGKVFALEHPERWRAAIDLPAQPAAADFSALVDELLSPAAGEDQIALRGGVRHVARLERSPLPLAEPASLLTLRSDAAYWITGGTGALGLQVARWLVSRGARQLVLTARRPAEPAELAEFRAAGADVRVLVADVAEPADVRRVLDTIARELGPLRGIVHAAGRLGREPLATLTPEALADVLRPKLAGARVLQAATEALPLDFLILFSSIASVWGAKGQAHYAAANHALDAFAQRQRAHGRPVWSVNWGPWSGGGMAGDAEQALLGRYGIAPLEPAFALQALERILASETPQRVVARIDWRVFKDFFELRGAKPFLSGIAASTPVTAEPGRSQEVETLLHAPVAERKARLESYLQAEVAAALGFKDGRRPDLRQGFFALGMDSMIAVDLRRRLAHAFARNLPSTLVFDHANIRLLADYLASEVLGWGPAAAATPAAPAPAPAAEPAPVDETDLEAALARHLEKLESLIRDP